MTYSKGPWIYDAESGEIHTKDRTGFWGPDHEPVVVATVEPLDGVNNGPLLAAAPELLRVAELVLLAQQERELRDWPLMHLALSEAVEAACAAIAKAEAMQ